LSNQVLPEIVSGPLVHVTIVSSMTTGRAP
jgi:hypothetical protein